MPDEGRVRFYLERGKSYYSLINFFKVLIGKTFLSKKYEPLEKIVCLTDGRPDIGYVFPDEACRLYSIYSEPFGVAGVSGYNLYKDEECLSEKASWTESPSDIHILHLENAFLIKGIGVFAEDGRCLHPFFLGRRGENIFSKSPLRFENLKRAAKKIRTKSVEIVEDDVFYCDTRNFGYGHFVLEGLSKFWALPHLNKNIRVASSVSPSVLALCLEAFGSKARPFDFGTCVFCKSLYVATQPMFLHAYVSAQAQEAWFRIGRGLRRLCQVDDSGPKRLFLSRQNIGKRFLINGDEVETLFQRNNFVSISPEKMTFRDQIRMVLGADKVVAPYGSAIFNCVFNERPASLFVMTAQRAACEHFSIFDDKRWRLGAFLEEEREPDIDREDEAELDRQRRLEDTTPWRLTKMGNLGQALDDFL